VKKKTAVKQSKAQQSAIWYLDASIQLCEEALTDMGEASTSMTGTLPNPQWFTTRILVLQDQIKHVRGYVWNSIPKPKRPKRAKLAKKQKHTKRKSRE
jgi:hypothetical protein